METEKQIIFPGSTFGIIGDSPNGIMLARAAKQLGFTVAVFSRSQTNPALAEADIKTVAGYSDKAKLQDFAQRCDFVSYESATVDSEVVSFLSRYTTIPQGVDVLELTQDRLLERAFFEQLNYNIAPYATIVSLDDIYQAVTSIGYPCVLKPVQKIFGRTDIVIERESDIAKCADYLDYGTYILESMIPDSKEIQVYVAQDSEQNATYFPLVEVNHLEPEFHEASIPATIDQDVEQELKRLTTQLLPKLHYVGVLEIAFIVTDSGSIYVKNIEPAPSVGGYVFDHACNVSMMQQHLRALASMPLMQPQLIQPAVLVEFGKKHQDALSRQWVLKDNWFYNFYRYPETSKQPQLGFVTVAAESVQAAKDQIEDTNIWTQPAPQSDENEYLDSLSDLGIDPNE